MSCACFVLVHLDGKSVAEQLAESMKHEQKLHAKCQTCMKKTWHVSYKAPERFGLCNNKGFKGAAICLNHHEHRCGPPRVAGQFPKDKASIKMHAFNDGIATKAPLPVSQFVRFDQ